MNSECIDYLASVNNKKVRRFPLPVKGQSYTVEEICKLDIRDMPSLCFKHRGLPGVIQQSHLTQEQFMSVPGMKESRWIYERETSEWIPIFYFDTNAIQLPITALVDIEIEINTYKLNPTKGWWATPKGFPRDQRF